MQRIFGILGVLVALLFSPAGLAQDESLWGSETWRLDAGITFNRFEQQVKAEIGGAVGERLVEETQFGLAMHGTYRVWGPFALGLYAQYDVGHRSAGRFEAFDAEGKAVTSGRLGGTYHEFWFGPLLRIQWKGIFTELAYAPLGIRFDDARSDLPSAGGRTDTALHTSPAVAWYVAIGGAFEVIDHLELVIRMEYRVRYYDRRSDGAFAQDLAHGTQNITPFIGVAWVP